MSSTNRIEDDIIDSSSSLLEELSSNEPFTKEEEYNHLHVESNQPLEIGQIIESPNGPLILLRMEGSEELFAIPCSRTASGIEFDENIKEMFVDVNDDKTNDEPAFIEQNTVESSTEFVLDEFVKFNKSLSKSPTIDIKNDDEYKHLFVNDFNFDLKNINNQLYNEQDNLNNNNIICNTTETYDYNKTSNPSSFDWEISKTNDYQDAEQSDDSNDPRPVYLNLNLYNKSVEKENRESFNYYTNKEIIIPECVDFEYIDQNGETVKATYANDINNNENVINYPTNFFNNTDSNNLQENQMKLTDYANLTNKIMPKEETILTMNDDSNNVINSEEQIENLIEFTVKDIRKNYLIETKVIEKKPLQTKMPNRKKSNLTPLQQTLPLENKPKPEIIPFINDLENKFKLIDNTEISIPIIQSKNNVPRERKQSFKNITVTDIFFGLDSETDQFKTKKKKGKSFKNINTVQSLLLKENCNPKPLKNIISSNTKLITKTDINLDSSDTDIDSDHWPDEFNQKISMKCSVCSKLFKTSRSLVIHQKRCTPPNVSPTFEKKKDITSPKTEKIVQKNIKISLKNNGNKLEKLIETEHIPLKKIKLRNNEIRTLMINDKTSSLSNKFICDICKKSFRFENHLNIHKKSHDNTYKCNLCDKKFNFKNALVLHYKRCKKKLN